MVQNPKERSMTRHIVIEGNLTRDPNGGYGKDTGKAYTHLDIAVTDRTRNTNGDWVDGPPTYYRVTTFGKTAENWQSPQTVETLFDVIL